MENEVFEQLVTQAVESLPSEFKEKLDNIDIVIEDIATPAQLAAVKVRHPLALFGLYQGIPQTKRGLNYSFVAPDKISIFKIPILYAYKTPSAIKRKVRAVVLHEIGHHFGLSEADLAKHASG